MPTGKCLKSLPFTIGGHRWCIRYYPNGNKPEVKDYISLFLHLDESVDKAWGVCTNVAGQTFAAHRCVLAARSSVFSAELYGVMKESDTGGVVRIEDMDARVFKALLYFIYTDLFPKTAKEEGDRYNLERLKLLCENKLCEYIDVGNVAIILALAEQHRCHELKKACLDFLSSPANLKAAVASDGFKHLSRSCPSVFEELIAMLAN
ncbi:hypothetical protein HU200_022640 [Digitaria exilis]|uniref:Uncharacterized protein n=1 Tax=Digitaria exilis TaxID=1010633 RepID=A0A835C6U6_9POAL|nr:hypothetical protein HU200_022640 [Digitaria exilis]